MTTFPYNHPVRPPAALLAEWETAHTGYLHLADEHDGHPLSPRELVDAQQLGLDALRTATELGRALQAHRWPTVHHLLTEGTSIEVVAYALDVPVREVRCGIRGWAKAQRALLRYTGTDGMTQPQHDVAVELVAEPAAVTR